MNEQRRKGIKAISDRLMSIRAELTSIKGDEDNSRDNMPPSMWGSEKFLSSEAASQSMEDADGAIKEAIDYLEDIG